MESMQQFIVFGSILSASHFCKSVRVFLQFTSIFLCLKEGCNRNPQTLSVSRLMTFTSHVAGRHVGSYIVLSHAYAFPAGFTLQINIALSRHKNIPDWVLPRNRLHKDKGYK